MASDHKTNQSGSYFVMTVLTAAALSTALAIIMSMIIAAAVVNGIMTETSTVYFIYALLLFAGFAGSLYGCIRTKGKYAIICIASMAVFIFEIIAANIIFCNGEFQRLGVSLIAIILGGAVACYISTVGKTSKIRRKVRH